MLAATLAKEARNGVGAIIGGQFRSHEDSLREREREREKERENGRFKVQESCETGSRIERCGQ